MAYLSFRNDSDINWIQGQAEKDEKDRHQCKGAKGRYWARSTLDFKKKMLCTQSLFILYISSGDWSCLSEVVAVAWCFQKVSERRGATAEMTGIVQAALEDEGAEKKTRNGAGLCVCAQSTPKVPSADAFDSNLTARLECTLPSLGLLSSCGCDKFSC